MADIFIDFSSACLRNNYENWNKKHFPGGEFQRNLAQSSRSLIETHNNILKFYSWEILQAK